MEFANEKVEELKNLIDRTTFTRKIFKAYSYGSDGYKNLDRKIREFNMDDTIMDNGHG